MIQNAGRLRQKPKTSHCVHIPLILSELSGRQCLAVAVDLLPDTECGPSALRLDLRRAILTDVLVFVTLCLFALGEDLSDLLFEVIGIRTDLRQLLALEIVQAGECGDAVVILAVIHLLQPDLHHTAEACATAHHESAACEFPERFQAGGRQRHLQRQKIPAAQQVKRAHIFTGLAGPFRRGTIFVHCARCAQPTGLTNAQLAVRGRAQRRRVFVVIAALRPVSIVQMMVDDHAGQVLRVVGIVRVV